MGYPESVWERAMTVQAVILKAVSGEIHWFRAADILGWSPRTLRRWRERYEAYGYAGLVDKRLHRPSIRRAPPGEVEQVLRLYRERYAGFNVRHFHETVQRAHAVTLSYSFVKQALQQAGLVNGPREPEVRLPAVLAQRAHDVRQSSDGPRQGRGSAATLRAPDSTHVSWRSGLSYGRRERPGCRRARRGPPPPSAS